MATSRKTAPKRAAKSTRSGPSSSKKIPGSARPGEPCVYRLHFRGMESRDVTATSTSDADKQGRALSPSAFSQSERMG